MIERCVHLVKLLGYRAGGSCRYVSQVQMVRSVLEYAQGDDVLTCR
jgi:hypothetical protein